MIVGSVYMFFNNINMLGVTVMIILSIMVFIMIMFVMGVLITLDLITVTLRRVVSSLDELRVVINITEFIVQTRATVGIAGHSQGRVRTSQGRVGTSPFNIRIVVQA